MMRSKSFPVRSWRNSLHPSPSLPDEIFGSPLEFVTPNTHCDPPDDVEIVPFTFDVPHKKRHYLVTSETCSGGGGSEPLLNSDACIVCQVSDKRVSRCCGSDCPLSFHIKCLNAELGKSVDDDLTNPHYCPYCWLILQTHILALREKATVAEKPVLKFLDKEMKSRDDVKESVPKSQEDTTFHGDGNGNQEHSPDFVSDQELHGEEEDACSCKVQVGKDSNKSRGESMPLVEETGKLQVTTDNFQDAEDQIRWILWTSKEEETLKDEIFGSPVEFFTPNTHCDPPCGSYDVEIVPVTFDVPHKKRHYLVTSETSSEGGGSEPLLNSDACIVCDVSDKRVSRCCGSDCLLSFHVECLNAELGNSVDDLANPYYCPYCWFNILALREKAALKYLEKEMKSRDEVKESFPKSQDDTTFHGDGNGNQEHSADFVSDQECQGEEEDACSCRVKVGKDSYKSRGESMPLVEETGKLKVGTDNFQDAEDDETAQDQTRVNTAGAGQKGAGSGKENDQVQQNEKRIRRRRIVLEAIDSETSSSESTNEQTGEDVTEQITKVAKSKTVRDISFFNKDQRRRILWTSKEEEMLKVGVEKFSEEANKNMPWRKILEMGKKVFHETRTPANLKDKWRNMIKASNEQDSNTNHSNGS